MSIMVFVVLSFFPRGVLNEILNLIESVSEGFSSYSYMRQGFIFALIFLLPNVTSSFIELLRTRISQRQ